MSSESLTDDEHAVSEFYEISAPQRPDSAPTSGDSRLYSLLSAMEANMSETNKYLKGIFDEHNAAKKRPRASIENNELLIIDEAEQGEQHEHSAPKRAKIATKSGHNSDGNDRSFDQQSPESESTEGNSEIVHESDDTLSLFGGPEIDSEIENAVDNDDLLSEIAQTLSSKEQTGPPISEKLAKIINAKLSENFDVTKLKEILNKYPRPKNCEQMYVPRINQEIWQKMKPFTKKGDIKMANLQDSTIKGLSGLACSIDNLLQCRENKTIPNYRALIPTLLDVTALFGHVCKELSYKRKEAIRPILHPDFKPLCARTHKVGPLLFGEDLAKCAQDIRSSSKTVMNLIPNPGQRAQTIFTKRFSSTQSQARKPFLYQQGRAQFPPRKPQNFQNRKTFTKN